jgi:integrase
MKLPKYTQAWVDSEGRPHHYFRRPCYPRVPLKGLPWSPQFMADYEAALQGPQLQIGAKRTKPGSLDVAVIAYYTSLEFRSLALGTQKMRRAILERFRREHGDKPIALLPQKFIAVMLSKMKPFAARNWLKTIRHLMQFCLTQELCAVDPTIAIRLPRRKTDGHETWTEAEIAKFEAAHPVGTQARLALALGLEAFLRRGDAVALGPQHLRDDYVLTFRMGKTGKPLSLPLMETSLPAIIAATPSGNMAFLVSSSGRPFTAASFGAWFRKRCDEAGLPNHCSFHGLRKAAMCRGAGKGWSANELAAWSGHVSLREVERYTKQADQEKMARNALARSPRTKVG